MSSEIMELRLVCVVFAIFLIGLLILLFLFYRSNRKHQEELFRLGQYSYNIQAVIDKSIPAILDSIIEDCFTDYQIMELIPKDDIFIGDEKEKEIREKLVDLVVNRISPAALDKISLFYNVRKIDEVIADKIYITVMNYCVAHNALVKDQHPETAEPKS